MKRISILFASAAVACCAVSCSDFFEREPENEFAANMFFETQTDLMYYTNGLIDAAMPSADNLTMGDDVYTDLSGTRASKAFFQPGRYHPGIATGWSYSSFGFLRQVAYMLDNMQNAKGNVSDEIYNHYEGVARFFRAYATFNKVRTFGDMYWIDRVVTPDDSDILYGPRLDREYIMHNVIEDLRFATENCLEEGQGVYSDGCIYINRYTALAMASRICLYEASYRKYHDANPSTGKSWNGTYESSEDLFRLAKKWSLELIEEGKFSLHPDYRALFTSEKLPSDEVIWGKSFSEELGKKHNVTYQFVSTTSSALYSPTKEYVMMFLKDDGTPVQGGEISMSEEFDGRDRRLTACILGPGQKKTDQSGNEVDFAPNFTWTTTGYVWIKWVTPDYESMNRSNNASVNSIPILRYAEVLLNYAEAVEELGEMTKDIWDMTIGELRRVHGGIANSGYPGGAGYVADAFLRDYYTKEVMHPADLSDALLEIRRERVTELMFEQNSRYDDLMRWCMGDLIERRYNHQGWRGVYVTEEDAENGILFNGQLFNIGPDARTGEFGIRTGGSTADQNYTLSDGTHGYLLYHYKLEWDDKKYLTPIPTTALNVNPEIGQNEGWQWM